MVDSAWERNEPACYCGIDDDRRERGQLKGRRALERRSLLYKKRDFLNEGKREIDGEKLTFSTSGERGLIQKYRPILE